MRNPKQMSFIASIALLLLATAPIVQAQRNDILLVPARARIVRLGFDLHALRGVTFLSYRETDDAPVYVWNRSRRQWQNVNLAQITNTRNIPSNPRNVYVIGPASIIPDGLLDAFQHAEEIHRLETFSVAEILTALDASMDFTLQEWRNLAERFDLEITEIHQPRDRWGRFGPPRRYREQQEQQVPEQIIDAPHEQQLQPRETEPVHQTERIEIPETTESDPLPELPEEEPVQDEEEERIEDAAQPDEEDETLELEPAPSQQQEQKGERQEEPEPDPEEDEFPIK